MQNINNVHVVQPVVPQYRVDFFERLKTALDDRLYIYCSSSWPNSPKSVNLEIDKFHSKLNVSSFKDKVFFQSVLPILKNIRSNDVVIISGNPRIISNYLIIVYCKAVGAKLVWWGHGWTAGSRGNRSKLRQKIMNLADAILLYTDSEKVEYKKNSYVNRPLFALNNGLNLDEIDSYFEQDWDRFSSINNVAVYCGRLTKKSNILLLLEAVKNSQQIKKLIIVGDGELFDACEKYISDNEMKDSIDMMGAIYEPRQLADIFALASVFVFPGTIGLSVIHSMAHGLPVILHGSRYNHGPENVAANGKNALFFIENNSNSLCENIDKYFLLDNKTKLQLAKNARKTVEEDFNTKSMAGRFLEMLDFLNMD